MPFVEKDVLEKAALDTIATDLNQALNDVSNATTNANTVATDSENRTDLAVSNAEQAATEALSASDIDPNFISYIIGTKPPNASITGTIGAYYTSSELLQKLKWNGTAWVDVSEPISTKTYVDDKTSLLAIEIDAFANGEGKTFTSLTSAMAVDPLPDNNVPFRVDGDPDPAKDGNYIYASGETGGYDRLGDLIKPATTFDPKNDKYFLTGKVAIESDNDLAEAGTVYPIGTDLVAKQTVDSFQGFINDTGGVSGVTSSFFYSDYVSIPVEATSITYKGLWDNSSIYLAFYDINKNFISTVSRGATTISEKNNISVPANAAFLRASSKSDNIEIITEQYVNDTQIDTINSRLSTHDDVNNITYIFPEDNLITIQGVTQSTGYINDNGGVSSDSRWKYTDYLLLPIQTISITYKGLWDNPAIYLAFYDINKNFISTVSRGATTISEKNNISVPEGAAFLRATSDYSIDVEIYSEQIVYNYKASEILRQHTELQTTQDLAFYTPQTNLIDKQDVSVQNGFIDDSGVVKSNANISYCEYVEIPVDCISLRYEGEWDNTSMYLAFYDTDKNFISVINPPATSITFLEDIAVPANAVYVRASSRDEESFGIFSEQYSVISFDKARTLTKTADKLRTNLDDKLYNLEPYEVLDQRYYDGKHAKLPNFWNKYLNKDDDCTIALSGTSQTVGSTYATTKQNPELRPIYCQANDLAGYLFDHLSWDGQQYRRYDSGYFTEAGTWFDKISDASWDDGNKDIFARASTGNEASLSFVVPVDAWAFRFVYKTEVDGDTCTVSVTEGDSHLEVYDEDTSSWVEANGFTFSTVDTADYPNGRGNTIYGKRLKFRARNGSGLDTRSTAKNVTITKSTNTLKRLTYWGVEWAKREYMLTVINGARGSHSWGEGADYPDGLNTANTGVSDVFQFNPVLVINEISYNKYWNTYQEAITVSKKWYFNELPDGSPANEPLSMAAQLNDFADTDILFFMPPLSYDDWTDNTESGDLIYAIDIATGLNITQKNKYEHFVEWFLANKTDFALSDSQSAMEEVGEKYYVTYAQAMSLSGAGGDTLTSVGVHWNSRGMRVAFECMKPWFII